MAIYYMVRSKINLWYEQILCSEKVENRTHIVCILIFYLAEYDLIGKAGVCI